MLDMGMVLDTGMNTKTNTNKHEQELKHEQTQIQTSMREAVGTGNHKTASDMVQAADALWDA